MVKTVPPADNKEEKGVKKDVQKVHTVNNLKIGWRERSAVSAGEDMQSV